MPAQKTYNASDIEVLTGLDPVRKRPGMYTDTASPNFLAQEVIDNSVDEAVAGYANRIEVTLHPDGSLSVEDNGRGMPTDIHPEHRRPGAELILTTLHAGAKFGQSAYYHSGGLHGVGISVVNALSTFLDAEICRAGKRWLVGCQNGDIVHPLKEVGSCSKSRTGTKVRFMPDGSYFDRADFSPNWLAALLRAKAVLLSGLTTRLIVLPQGETQSWQYQDGLQDYLVSLLPQVGDLPSKPLYQHFETGEIKAEWVLSWLPGETSLPNESYVNLVPTVQGGTHVNGLRSGMLEAVREYCEFRDLLPRSVRLTVEDVCRNCAWVLSLRMNEPRFTGQTKERLASREIVSIVTAAVRDALSAWLLKHTSEGDRIVALVIENALQRQRQAKATERKRLSAATTLPGKLADCISTNIEETELFLVEGDSAGGSAKQARDRHYQAILPLRGKILNSWEVDSDAVLASKEVHDISVAVGIMPGAAADSGRLRYGRICILADADPDGRHIATLLCALFLKHFRSLVEAGRIFVVMPPLFRVSVGGKVSYALDSEERDKLVRSLKNHSGKLQVQRFKGLGEMNPQQLRETAMKPGNRRLLKLTLAGDGDEMLDMLLARKRAADRRSWLENCGNRSALHGMSASDDQQDVAASGDQQAVAAPGDQQEVAAPGDQQEVAASGDQQAVAASGDQQEVAVKADTPAAAGQAALDFA